MEAGLRQRDDGIGYAAGKKSRRDLVQLAIYAAIDVGQRQAEVTMDDVLQELERRGVDHSNLGPAAGSVFRNRDVWLFTGQWRKSARVSNHARVNRVWTLKA